MTQLAVVAFPLLKALDREWLEDFRRSHDPQASRLAGHFTLMFPADAELAVVAERVGEVAGLLDPFDVSLHAAKAVPDQLAGAHHVFLLPDQGTAELVALHDALYTGRLRPHLRQDVAFLPHLTIGAAGSHRDCERLADHAQVSLPFRATVQELAVLELSATIRSVKTVRLRRGRPPTRCS